MLTSVIILRVTVTRDTGGGGGGMVTPSDGYSVGCVAVLSDPGHTELRWRRVWHHACRLDI